MRRRSTWVLTLLIMLLVACTGGPAGMQPGGNDTEVVTAFIGDLAATATASGKVLPQRNAALAVEAPGRVDQVFVRVGDRVEPGEALVQLETEGLELALASAWQDLAVQEANLLALRTPPEEAEIKAAEAALTSAEAQLDALLAGPRPEEVASAEANLRAAEAGVWSSSGQLNQTRESVTEVQIATARANVAAAELALLEAQERNEAFANIDTHNAMLDAQAQLENARAELEALLAGPDSNAVGAAQADVGAAAARRDARQAELDLLLREPTAGQVAQAEARVAQAGAALADLEEEPSAEEVRAAEAQVEQARLAVADAEAALAGATVRAPFAGVVTAVRVSEGELASNVVVELVDRESLRVVLTVDEADIGGLEVGQPAVVTLEVWPDEELESEIVDIAPAATTDGSGLVSYEVFLKLDETDLAVRAGMTANARMVTARRDEVLLVPNRAIIVDRQTGTYYVDLLVPGGEGEGNQVERVEINIGLRDDENTQITSGLEAGDRLQIGALRSDLPFGPPDN